MINGLDSYLTTGDKEGSRVSVGNESGGMLSVGKGDIDLVAMALKVNLDQSPASYSGSDLSVGDRDWGQQNDAVAKLLARLNLVLRFRGNHGASLIQSGCKTI
jgi:hypothetical protein